MEVIKNLAAHWDVLVPLLLWGLSEVLAHNPKAESNSAVQLLIGYLKSKFPKAP